MAALFVLLGIVVPVFLAFSLLSARWPQWLGWAMWGASAVMALVFWIWMAGISPVDGTRFYGGVIAVWFSLWPLLALAIRIIRNRKTK